jgi:hypothetical protein
MTEGAMNDYLHSAVNRRFTPDMDLYIYSWTGDVDPTFILSIFLTSQINNWSDCAWSDPQYDALFKQQSQTLDSRARKDVIWEMQRILYRQIHRAGLPQGARGARHDALAGLGAVAGGRRFGDLLRRQRRHYLYAHPKEAAAASRSPSLLIALLVAAASVAGIVVWLLLRRRPKPLED